MNMSHIVQVTELKLFAKFHDDWSKQSVSNVTSPNYANYEVTQALTCLSTVTYKISKTAEILCKARHFIKEDLLWSLYPHLTYGNIGGDNIWGDNYTTRLDSLIKMQKEVVRVITFSSYTEWSKPLFQNLEIPNVDQINDQQTILFCDWPI